MITITYKCRCMAEEASIEVQARQDGEDVVDWMQRCVQVRLGLDHERRSPFCRATAVEYVKLPVPENAPFIGAQPKFDA